MEGMCWGWIDDRYVCCVYIGLNLTTSLGNCHTLLIKPPNISKEISTFLTDWTVCCWYLMISVELVRKISDNNNNRLLSMQAGDTDRVNISNIFPC